MATNSMGLKVVRVTDGNTEPAHLGSSFINNPSGSDVDQHASIDDSMFVIARDGGIGSYLYLLTSNSVSGIVVTPVKVSSVPYQIPSKFVAFSQVTAKTAYVLTVVQSPAEALIQKYDLTSCTATFCSPTPTNIYDFAQGNCLSSASGFTPSWNSVFRVSSDDTMFSVSFSNNQGGGGQGSGTLIATYKTGSGGGCRVWNSGNSTVAGIAAGSVVGDYGPTGLMNMTNCNNTAGQCYVPPGCMPGVNCAPADEFTIHDTYQAPSNAWTSIQGTTCLNGCTTPNDAPYAWQIATLNVLATGLGGHFCLGNNNLVHSTNSPQGEAGLVPIFSSGSLVTSITNYNLISTSSPNNIGPPNADPDALNLDQHCSWNYDNSTDTSPVFISTSDTASSPPDQQNNGCAIPYPLWASSPSCGTTNPFTGPFVNEIMIYPTASPSGGTTTCTSSPCSTLPILRVGNSYISANSWNFNAANATMSAFPSGKYYLFTSDWLCTLGASSTSATRICGGIRWQASHSYNANDIITPSPSQNNALNCTFQTTTGGTSGSSVPANEWVSGGSCVSSPASDGTVTWTLLGTQNMRADVFVGATK
jgi:hypothetical protein